MVIGEVSVNMGRFERYQRFDGSFRNDDTH